MRLCSRGRINVLRLTTIRSQCWISLRSRRTSIIPLGRSAVIRTPRTSWPTTITAAIAIARIDIVVTTLSRLWLPIRLYQRGVSDGSVGRGVSTICVGAGCLSLPAGGLRGGIQQSHVVLQQCAGQVEEFWLTQQPITIGVELQREL